MKLEYITKTEWIQMIQKKEPYFVWTNEHRTVALLLLQYINCDEDFELPRKAWYLKMAEETENKTFKAYLLERSETANGEYYFDLNRGIALIGTPGVFKTTFFKVLQQVFNNILEDPRRFAITSFRELIEKYKVDAEVVFQKYSNLNVMIDDFGALKASEENIKYFGSELNPVEYITTWRYNLFEADKKKVFHFTSNLSLQDFKNRYEEYCHSRIEAMCNIIAIESKNRRTMAKKTPQIPSFGNDIDKNFQPDVKRVVGDLMEMAEKDGSEAAKNFAELLKSMKAKRAAKPSEMSLEDKKKYEEEKFKYSQSAFWRKWEEFARSTITPVDVRIQVLEGLVHDAKMKGHTSDQQKLESLIQELNDNQK